MSRIRSRVVSNITLKKRSKIKGLSV